MYMGWISFPLVLLLYHRLAGNEHLRPDPILWSRWHKLHDHYHHNQHQHHYSDTHHNDNNINLTTNTQTSANMNAHLPRRLLFLGYTMGFQIWDCTNLSADSEVLNLLA